VEAADWVMISECVLPLLLMERRYAGTGLVILNRDGMINTCEQFWGMVVFEILKLQTFLVGVLLKEGDDVT
jgi:hypothetical protein